MQILDEPGIIGYFCEKNFERLSRCEILAEKKGVTVAQIAMAWIYNQNFDVYAISSPANTEHLASNIGAMELALSSEEVAYLALEKN